MKTNLDKLFKSNIDFEKEGIWFEIGDSIRFRVRRFGGSNSEVKKAMVKYYKPFAKLIERGLLSDEKEKDIYIKSFIDACLVDWEGVEVDGEIVPFSFENAHKLFTNLPELVETLMEYAQASDHYRVDLGN